MTATRLSRKKRRMQQQQREADDILNKKFFMKKINPITQRQEDLFESYSEGYHLAAIGSAGTGKTMCALYLALKDVMEDETDYEKIIVIRSAVQTRDQGFMPGSLKEKMSYYEGAYIDIVNDLFGRGDAYSILQQKGMIEFKSSSFVRGLTFDNSIIIVDEAQSMTYHELDSIMTRVGESSRIIFCGDIRQDDLKISKNRADISGLADFIRVIKKIDAFDIVEFTTADIVRSGIVKEYLIAKERELELV